MQLDGTWFIIIITILIRKQNKDRVTPQSTHKTETRWLIIVGTVTYMYMCLYSLYYCT